MTIIFGSESEARYHYHILIPREDKVLMKKFFTPILLLLVSSALAQQPAVQQPPASQPAPQATTAAQSQAVDTAAAALRQAEQKKFQAAAAEKDPKKKVKALQAFLKASPKSPMAAGAQRELVATLIKVSPGKAAKWMQDYGKKAVPGDRVLMYRHYAATLLKEGKNLPEAEKYASQAIQDCTWDAYVAFFTKQRMAPSGRPSPPEAMLKRSYNGILADLHSTLGQIHSAAGSAELANAQFHEALRLNPELAEAAQGLAEGAEKQGKTAEALEWRARAALIRPSKERKTKFAETYVKVKGDAQGAEDYLDITYHRVFPPPIHAEPYQSSANRSRRVVLAEVYTGAGCPPCVGADVAFDAVLERYRRDDVAVVMYHEHIPRPDPLTNADTASRWKWQQGRGVPTYGVDGEMSNRGGGTRQDAKEIEEAVRKAIDRRLDTPQEASLDILARRDGPNVMVWAEAGGVTGKATKLNILLVEKLVRYSGENSVRFHPMVVRGIASHDFTEGSVSLDHVFNQDIVAAALKAHIDGFEKYDERHNKDGSFRFMERRDTIDWGNIAVVAFVQDSESKKVLQAAWADLSHDRGKGEQ